MSYAPRSSLRSLRYASQKEAFLVTSIQRKINFSKYILVQLAATTPSNSPLQNTADTHVDITLPIDTSKATASSSKVKAIKSSSCCGDNEISGYRLIDVSIFADLFASFACPECSHTGLRLQEHRAKQRGFSNFISVVCQCGYSRNVHTSKRSNKGRRYDVNTRIIYAARSCGLGYAGIKKFAGLMNIPTSFCKKTYQNVTTDLRDAVKLVAVRSMAAAAKEINDSGDVRDTGVSLDGAWQRRGYSSLNGVVTTISIITGKVLDTEPMSRHCQTCERIQPLKSSDPLKFELVKGSHTCKANYAGSAPSMEPEGAVRMFSRSIHKHNLRYSEYYGDGDSKSHLAVQNLYDGIKVLKQECIGHVQKRVGNRLRKLKTKVKGLGGRGKLTNATIDKLQNYYGIAIRTNSGDLDGMKRSVLASLFHVASSKESQWHDYCPKTANSWCLYQRDRINNTSTFKPGVGLPMSIVTDNLKPIYADLSSDALLQKCLHGMTQNANESFNALIWERVPKSRYVGFNQLEIAVYDAVSVFNDGRSASLEILSEMGLEPGLHCEHFCRLNNKVRIDNSLSKSSDSCKLRRKIIRGKKKKKDDKNMETEGKTYEPGGFV